MKVAIVYESLFGNTHQVAAAVSDGIVAAHADAQVQCLPVADAGAEQVAGADLLVVGGPTHMRRMTSGLTRKMGISAERKAAADGAPTHPMEPGAQGPGVRDWLDTLPKARPGCRAAAFDTRAQARFAGGAAAGIARRLERSGYDLAGKPAGFLIEDTAGPLRAGEVDRARAWGASLVQ